MRTDGGEENHMKLLLNCYVTNDFDGYQYAFLELTADLAQLILKRKADFYALDAKDGALTQIEYWDCSPIHCSKLPETLTETLGYGCDFVETSCFAEDFENLAERIECHRMVITRTDVYWTCFPKHVDGVHVETRPIGYDTVRATLAVEENSSPVK
jgi:hypothetical protein